MSAPHGVPTTYAGVHFRSRLEARWAAMFGFLGWRWEYEPEDLNGYIPDFVLMFPAGPVLVEVKPAYSVNTLIAAAAEKIDRSGWSSANANDALILGATWNPGGDSHWCPTAGALRQGPDLGDGHISWGAALWHRCGGRSDADTQGNGCGEFSLHHDLGSWVCTVCGAYDGDGLLGEAPNGEGAWREAGNVVRWRGVA